MVYHEHLSLVTIYLHSNLEGHAICRIRVYIIHIYVDTWCRENTISRKRGSEAGGRNDGCDDDDDNDHRIDVQRQGGVLIVSIPNTDGMRGCKGWGREKVPTGRPNCIWDRQLCLPLGLRDVFDDDGRRDCDFQVHLPYTVKRRRFHGSTPPPPPPRSPSCPRVPFGSGYY